MTASLSAAVGLALGGLSLDVDIEVEAGSTVAVLGPNGAGKTTLLRAIAGLQPIDSGRIALGDAVLDDPRAGVFVEPELRPVGVVFQDLRLFPHLSAVDNVAFGLRCRGVRRGAARERSLAWLERAGLAGHADARPGQLSGGQAQRVALARALVAEPLVLLLDEPLAAMDAATRVATRRDLRRHLDGHAGVRILVTHDPVEAAALAETVAVVEGGRVVQSGSPAEIAARPRSRYAADLAGVNLLSGRAEGHVVRLAGGFGLAIAERADGEVLVVVHPRAIALHPEAPHGTPRNVWPAHVGGIDLEADRARVRLLGPLAVVAEITRASLAELHLAEGAPVWVSLKATGAEVYPA